MQRLVLALLVASCRSPAAPPSIPPAAPDFRIATGEETADDEDVDAPRPEPPRPRGCAPTPGTIDRGTEFTRVRTYVDLVMRRLGAPSVVVAVGQAGALVWAKGFGFADKARRRRATPDTPYSLASVSKPFTATGIMVLREQGRLGLDEPINTHLGEPGVHGGVGDPSGATIERVANHTAGLPLYMHFFYRGTPIPDYQTTRRDFAVLVTKPGERFEYSNLGYGLLEQVIANVSGESYADFMRAEVFAPLGLAHTSVGPPRGAAVRYDGRGEAIPPYRTDHEGASAIYSSARDLIAFGMTHLGFVRAGAEPLLPPAAIARMREIQPPSETYGLGWGVSHVGGHTVIGHSGGMPGVTTGLMLVPDYALVVAVLVNADIGDAIPDLAHAAYTDLGLPVRADAICRLPTGHPLLGRYEGTLAGPRGPVPMMVSIEHDGKVEATIDGGVPLPLWDVHIDDDGGLSALTFADLAAPAAEGEPSDVTFDLQPRGDRLTGSVTARIEGVAALTYFADLKKPPVR